MRNNRFIPYTCSAISFITALMLLFMSLNVIGGSTTKKGYLYYDKKVAKGRKTGIAAVKKLYESRDMLIVDVSYHYKGEFGDKAYLHVSPAGVPNQTVVWSYQIIKLLKGSHTVSVRVGRPVPVSGYKNTYITSNFLVVSLRSRKIDADNKERYESFVREVVPYKKYWAWGEQK